MVYHTSLRVTEISLRVANFRNTSVPGRIASRNGVLSFTLPVVL